MAIKANKTACQISDLTIAWMHANMFDLHIYCALRRNSVNKGFGLWIPMARQDFNRRERRFNFCISPGFEPEPGELLVTRDSLLVTRVSPFAKASGDRPPRHADACHPSVKGELGMILVRAAPRRTIQSWNRHRLNMLCCPL